MAPSRTLLPSSGMTRSASTAQRCPSPSQAGAGAGGGAGGEDRCLGEADHAAVEAAAREPGRAQLLDLAAEATLATAHDRSEHGDDSPRELLPEPARDPLRPLGGDGGAAAG